MYRNSVHQMFEKHPAFHEVHLCAPPPLTELLDPPEIFLTYTLYTFSHCESAPSQLNAAWGNSFRQLHSNFDNLLALRHISLE